MSELVNYDAILALLNEYPVDESPAMLHGALCGLLSAGQPVSFADWWQNLQKNVPTVIIPTEDFQTFFTATQNALDDPGLSFSPLVPGDEAPLSERTFALGQWCQSWLYGLTLAGSEIQQNLTGNAAEAVQDLNLIASLETETANTEAEEFAYENVLEYVRIAVLLVREECLSSPPKVTENILH